MDERAARAHAAKAFVSDIDRAVQTPDSVIEGAYKLLAADAAGVPTTLAAAVQVRHLLSLQRRSGEWGGSGIRPPSAHSPFARTALATRAIQLHRHAADAAAARTAVGRARAWLRARTAPDTEGRAYQLLGLLWTGESQPLRSRLARALLATQRPDGGWGSIDGRNSEAYSTGEALVALHDAGGISVNDARWRRGVEFLVKTQAGDGTWHVPSRLHDPGRFSPAYFESGYPYGHDQFISVSGASWAIMALSLALPTVASEPLTPVDVTRTQSIEPWVETVLFGPVADLERLLARGLDPNAATSSGQTSALMIAAPDAAKMRLLIERGADVNAVSRLGGTPLTVAARYGRGEAAINLLLDRGAKVASAIVDRQPRRSALPAAAFAGNRHAINRLSALGEDGNAPPLPLTLAIGQGDIDVVRALLDLGAYVNRAEQEAWSPLERAVVTNDVAIARLLLARGADVNQRDRAGYTALLLAASIDFGDTAMIDLLLSARARIDLRNPHGDTPLELARKYGHLRLVQRLELASKKPAPRPVP